jgi:hypothetical protein
MDSLRFVVCLGLLSVMSPAGYAWDPSRHTGDPVEQTMLIMRLFSTQIQDQLRNTGTLPAADDELRPIRTVIGASGLPPGRFDGRDAWGNLIHYRARLEHSMWISYQLISYGADGRADRTYAGQPWYGTTSKHLAVADAASESADLILTNGRFVQRPFGGRTAEFETINAINRRFIMAASYAVDNNHYPGNTDGFVPVTELATELLPIYGRELPTLDGWGRPLLYYHNGFGFVIASFGANGVADETYYPDVACGVVDEPTPHVDGGDALQACGQFIRWPRGTEP